MGRWPSNLAVFGPRLNRSKLFALARTSPVTSFPRRREPSQVSEKTGLAMTTRLRQLSRSPVAKDALRLVWVPACAGMTDGGGGMGALHLDRKDPRAVALRRHDEKLEHATTSIRSPPRDDQPHHFWFRCAIDARLTPGTICLDCAHSLNCLPGRARVARDPGSRPRKWALGSPPRRTAADATPALRAVALRPGRQDHGSVAVELRGFPTEIESVETFALARTSPVTSFPRRREPSQVSAKPGLAMTTRLRQLSRPPREIGTRDDQHPQSARDDQPHHF